MSLKMNKKTYMDLIDQDLDLLNKNCSDTPERDHIKLILCKSIEFYYPPKKKDGKITDRIKTYEDACEELDETPLDEKVLTDLGFTTDEINYRKIKTITKALNEGWKADWNDSNQYKYYPWFKMSSGGFVFCDMYYDRSYANAGYASRLCFKSSELAKYAGEQFLQLYSDFIK